MSSYAGFAEPLIDVDGIIGKETWPWLGCGSSTPPSPPSVIRSGKLYAPGLARCLDIEGASTANGTPVQVWDCVDVANQDWTLYSNGEIRGYGGNCLDVRGPSTADGTPVQIWDCVGVANQKWAFNSKGQLVGYGGKCLTLYTNGNGQDTIMWDCNRGNTLKWQLINPVDIAELFKRCVNKKNEYKLQPFLGDYDCGDLAEAYLEAEGNPEAFTRNLAILAFKEGVREASAAETMELLIAFVGAYAYAGKIMLDHFATLSCAWVGGKTGVAGGGLCISLYTALTDDLDVLEATKIIACSPTGPYRANACKVLTDALEDEIGRP